MTLVINSKAGHVLGSLEFSLLSHFLGKMEEKYSDIEKLPDASCVP